MTTSRSPTRTKTRRVKQPRWAADSLLGTQSGPCPSVLSLDPAHPSPDLLVPSRPLCPGRSGSQTLPTCAKATRLLPASLLRAFRAHIRSFVGTTGARSPRVLFFLALCLTLRLTLCLTQQQQLPAPSQHDIPADGSVCRFRPRLPRTRPAARILAVPQAPHLLPASPQRRPERRPKIWAVHSSLCSSPTRWRPAGQAPWPDLLPPTAPPGPPAHGIPAGCRAPGRPRAAALPVPFQNAPPSLPSRV